MPEEDFTPTFFKDNIIIKPGQKIFDHSVIYSNKKSRNLRPNKNYNHNALYSSCTNLVQENLNEKLGKFSHKSYSRAVHLTTLTFVVTCNSTCNSTCARCARYLVLDSCSWCFAFQMYQTYNIGRFTVIVWDQFDICVSFMNYSLMYRVW